METLPVYTDFQSLAALRGEGLDKSAQLDEVAEQFASVFTHMMLKSMRDASLGEGILDSQQSTFYRDMFDQQLALSLSQSDGVGISSMLRDHLRSVTGINGPDPEVPVSASSQPGWRARDAYEGVQRMTAVPPQDRFIPADTVNSRNELQRDASESDPLRWRGQEPR